MLTLQRLISCALFLTATFAATFAQTKEQGAVATTNIAPAAASKTHGEALSPQAVDTTPAGMVAFFSPTTTACPAGWVAHDSSRGRLILGVIDGTRVGVTNDDTPMGDRTPPSHSHTYSASVKMSSKSLQAGKGGNKDGAKAKTYSLTSSTDGATLNLPFYQLTTCRKQ
jgi:hypothetical protein